MGVWHSQMPVTIDYEWYGQVELILNKVVSCVCDTNTPVCVHNCVGHTAVLVSLGNHSFNIRHVHYLNFRQALQEMVTLDIATVVCT